jgi:hypothetical protein
MSPPPQAAPPPAPAAAQLPPLPYADRNPSTHNGTSKHHHESFVASQGMLEVAAPIPSRQPLMTYLFKAMLDNAHYPKMNDTDGKANCLICFHGAFPAPHNSCQLDTCIATR